MKVFYSALSASMAVACSFTPEDGPVSDEYNDFSYNIGDIVGTSELCLSQGEGSYTFAMLAQGGSLGLPGSGTSGSEFLIMDNACKLLGLYSLPQDQCGKPFVLEANYLQYVLTLTDVDLDVGSPYFSFTYANGKYTIGNDHCVCQTISNNGNGAVKGCRCAFPVAGET